ncbi:hypothetical protein MGG_18054 [Pyricularia oryzae 70-15]|uniref:Uncharacterized protein n=3 Tax=Pyricularia oryzae TaxID=318829 RepID=G4NKN7_PYRO7|nr:uncharacterized protein MGG_18054 [Pyricularia oryzae 70-15]EHA46626.1 hypothetical protein MGG_18054 [Pyricularia oryzae 70-15]ELQ40856.1 hypothetical protein OOU_Y34scaffold00334g26 [Pyricularia oryzae Y34]
MSLPSEELADWHTRTHRTRFQTHSHSSRNQVNGQGGGLGGALGCDRRTSFGRLGSCRNVPPRFTPNGTGAAFCGAIRTRPGLGLLAVVVLWYEYLPGDFSDWIVLACSRYGTLLYGSFKVSGRKVRYGKGRNATYFGLDYAGQGYKTEEEKKGKWKRTRRNLKGE